MAAMTPHEPGSSRNRPRVTGPLGRPSRHGRRLVRTAAVLVFLILPVPACASERIENEQRQDYPQDAPTTGERAPSTGVPAESTTSTTEAGDGGLDDSPSESSIPGAQPGRPQLDGEPTQEPAG